MRAGHCVPMILLCLALSACGGGQQKEDAASAYRAPYQSMDGCTMEARVICSQEGLEECYTLACTYHAEDGSAEVEVLEPEEISGVQAALGADGCTLECEELPFSVGAAGTRGLSPAGALPRLMSALREGWLLEQNAEELDGTACLRLCLEQTGPEGGKIVSVLWLKDDHTPLRGEIEEDGQVILQVEFTKFEFDAIVDETL